MNKVAVIGLGYVGLPLAAAFAKHLSVVGFDVDEGLVEKLHAGIDPAGEVVGPFPDQLSFTTNAEALVGVSTYIVAVPTPIDDTKRPELTALRSATRCIGATLKPGDLVVYESTVYPGCTEDVCIPLLEQSSGLSVDEDFDVAYSPERVVPGDAAHSLEKVVKLVGARSEKVAKRVASLYSDVVGVHSVHRVSSIRVAEAAKVLENTQRDLNIALMNECALIFDRAGIDTNEVIEAAATKWNFHAYRPGLVGGHCIGVDPYYLTHMAELLGYHPEVILAGRRVNDSMGRFVATKTMQLLRGRGGQLRVAVLGLTFKENVRDLRNSRVLDLVAELEQWGAEVVLHDPRADPEQVKRVFGKKPVRSLDDLGDVDAVVLATAHDEYEGLIFPENVVLVDVKGLYDEADWRL